MFRNGRRPRIASVAVASAAALVAVGLAACSSSGSSSSGPAASGSASATGTKVTGGTATYALPPSVTLNYIFPFTSIANISTYNANQWMWLMYRPLYMFGDNSSTNVAVNYPLSPAQEPVYSNGGK